MSFDFFDGDKLKIVRQQDVEPVLDQCKEERNNGTNGFSVNRTWRKIGSIPMIFVEKILREKGINVLDGSPEAVKAVKDFLKENDGFRSVDGGF